MKPFVLCFLSTFPCIISALSPGLRMRAEAEPSLKTGGSSRLDQSCSYNTDCLDNMYCSAGLCACTSNAVAKDSHCYIKINPGQAGCQYTEQCTAVWPGTECSTSGGSTGTCNCPTNYSPAKTRDGTVCVQTTAADGAISTASCPMPELVMSKVNRENLRGQAGNTLMQCDPASANTGTTAGTDCVVNGQNVGDLYDCVAITGQATGANKGVCCPNRAHACAQPMLSGGTGGTTHTRFWYNSVTATCQQLSWNDGGTIDWSNTNSNNFGTLEHCQSYCKDSCARGNPEFTTATSQRDFQQKSCMADTGACTTDHSCITIGSNEFCCPDVSWICSNNGGRLYGGVAQTVADLGFQPVTAVKESVRYFYNTASGTCSAFSFKGAGGNFNNFLSQSDCSNYCSSQLCSYGRPLKLSNGLNQGCSSDTDCPNDFQCNKNNQATSVCCPRAQALCIESMQPGTCSQWSQRVYYDPYIRDCRLFEYSGCGGNDNNFNTMLQCQTFCKGVLPEPQCIQGKAYRDYSGNYQQCSASGYGSTCPANYKCYFDGYISGCCPEKAYACALSLDTGKQCGPTVGHWYFDAVNQRCETFQFKGCDGNPNNFPTRQLCENYCGIGGCPNGGSPASDSSTGTVTVCSAVVTCPSGYECESVVVGGAAVSYCCPTKAQICSQPPSQSSSCGSTSVQRYYFNPSSKSCTAFTYQGCDTNGNNFATLAQCNNYCSAAACKAGEVALTSSGNQQPVQCNPSTTNPCALSGYTCRYDQLNTKNICCGSGDEGVCPSGEKAYLDALTHTVRQCLPNQSGSCTGVFQCRFSFSKNKYYCCAPATGATCPAGKAQYKQPTTGQPQQCTLNIIYNTCPNGYRCQSAINDPYQVLGYCCSTNPICTGTAEFDKDATGNPIQCVPNSPYNSCHSGFSCQANTQGGTFGFCCKGGSTAENAGCPSNLYVYKLNGQIQTCSPFNSQPCPTQLGYSCQFAGPPYNRYQCCGATPVNNQQKQNLCKTYETQVEVYLTNGQAQTTTHCAQCMYLRSDTTCQSYEISLNQYVNGVMVKRCGQCYYVRKP